MKDISFQQFRSEATKYHFINSPHPKFVLNGRKIEIIYPTTTKIVDVVDRRNVEYWLH